MDSIACRRKIKENSEGREKELEEGKGRGTPDIGGREGKGYT